MKGSDYRIDCITAGHVQTNTYLLSSGGESIIIDPGTYIGELLQKLNIGDSKVVAIIATHGHFDHIMDGQELKTKLGSPFIIGSGEDDILDWSYRISERYLPRKLTRISVDRYLDDGDIVEFGMHRLNVMKVPGHTAGSLILVIGNTMFTGDTLFRENIGRTDLGGSMESMRQSLLRLMKLGSDYRVLPGHGEETTLSHELAYNPFLLELKAED